jgi:hypothetical protein
MRMLPHEVALLVLSNQYDADVFPSPRAAFSREGAWEFLRDLSGQDFGLDHNAWENWFRKYCSDKVQIRVLYESYYREKGNNTSTFP